MAAWPPQQVEIETQQWTVGDLRDGDLVFGQRAGGPFAKLCAAAGEPWMHVGSLTTDENGERVVVELRRHTFFVTDPASFFSHERYQSFGAARLRLRPECVDQANTWMRNQLQGNQTAKQAYPWDDYLLAGVIVAGHRGLITKCPDEVRAALAAAAAYAKETPYDLDGVLSLTCSAFVQVAYDQVGKSCAIEHPRWRSEPVSWPGRSPTIDEVFEMTEEELAGYDDASLVDLYLDSEGVDRGVIGDLRTGASTLAGIAKDMSGEQVSELFTVVVAALGGLAFGVAPAKGELAVDSRWVTPGDLWRSPSVLERGYVSV